MTTRASLAQPSRKLTGLDFLPWESALNMYIALLVRVTALSVMSRIGNVLHRHPVFASAMDVIDEMYENDPS